MRHDFFQLAQDKVESVLKKHNLDIDFKDDDTFADFVAIEIDKHNFNTAEKQYIYTYNCMLQTIAFTVENVNFYMDIDSSWKFGE